VSFHWLEIHLLERHSGLPPVRFLTGQSGFRVYSNSIIECRTIELFNHKIYKSTFISCTHCNIISLLIAYSKSLFVFNTILLIQNLKAEICVKVNFDLNFSQFWFFVKNNNVKVYCFSKLSKIFCKYQRGELLYFLSGFGFGKRW
jgi:hypothetical protein